MSTPPVSNKSPAAAKPAAQPGGAKPLNPPVDKPVATQPINAAGGGKAFSPKISYVPTENQKTHGGTDLRSDRNEDNGPPQVSSLSLRRVISR